MLVKAPFVGRWVGQQEDETDDDESFSFDELEKDGKLFLKISIFKTYLH
jgi:hypothetical protein